VLSSPFQPSHRVSDEDAKTVGQQAKTPLADAIVGSCDVQITIALSRATTMMTREAAAAATTAYERIKRSIVDCVYPPGSKLSEERLAGELGLGRSPIRSAFARLNSEGWLEVSPQSGSYVKALGEREISELFELRLLLEAHVTRLAARQITDEQLRKLRLGLKRTALAAKTGFDKATFDEFDEFDSMVHLTIYQAAGNVLMSQILLNLFEKAQWLKKMVAPSTPKRMKTWINELQGIVEALESHDGTLAVQRIREHVQVGLLSYQTPALPGRATSHQRVPTLSP
jgi:DNA-binding GntR family transcriptional regulator